MYGLLTILSFCCVVFVFGKNNINPDNFEFDYFFSRTRDVASKCENDKFKYECSVKCEGQYTCAFEKCLCLLHKKHSRNPETAKLNPKLHDILYVPDSFELNDSVEKTITLHLRQAPIFSPSELRPALRHHIAHFCENLDIARTCIRSCMKLGKPAFCGKDHVCYCGHKYDNHSKDPVVDPENTYAQFQDLYAKYFGSTEKNEIVTFHQDW